MPRSSRRLREAFSLTELIMALVILLVIIPQVVPIYEAFVRDSEEEALRSRLGQIRRALLVFYQENGRYPYQLYDHFGNDVDILDPEKSELTQGVHDGFTSYPKGRRIYLDEIPVDPMTGRTDWRLIGVDNDGDGAFNEDPINATTGTHRMSGVVRGLTTGIVDPLQNISRDDDGDGLVDEDPVDIYDVRSRSKGYGDL